MKLHNTAANNCQLHVYTHKYNYLFHGSPT